MKYFIFKQILIIFFLTESTPRPKPEVDQTSLSGDVLSTLACSRDETIRSIKIRIANEIFKDIPFKQLNVFYVSLRCTDSVFI